MAMGIVSPEDFDSEILKKNPRREESKSESPIPEIKQIERGRGNNPEVPDSLRKLIGQTSIESGRTDALQLAKKFGISPSSVSAYSTGATSTSSYNERPNEINLNNTRERIARMARKKLILALSKITDEKLEAAKVRDLAGIAKDMTHVVSAMSESSGDKDEKKGPTFVFYSPQLKEEKHFDVVNAKE